MLTNTTIEGLKSLRLPAMASGLLEQREHPDYAGLSFEERLGLLVDRELLQRQNRRLERVLKSAKLRSGAVVEDVDFANTRVNFTNRSRYNAPIAFLKAFLLICNFAFISSGVLLSVN